MLYIETASYSERGGHKINEDSFCCSSDFFAVADGLGGHIDGEKASRCAIEYLQSSAHGNYNEETVNELLLGANSAVLSGAAGARTTIAVLFTENGVFRYTNVGDSRVYIFRRDKVLAMTKDHSVCRAAVDMGTMEFDEIRRSEDRSKLLKVLGSNTALVLPKPYPPITMEEGDSFLICSDGFWDYVLESEMEADLLKSDTPEQWLCHMLKRHIAAAMNKGDNYTAICGMVKSKQESAAVPAAAPASASATKSFPAALLIAVPIIAAVAIAAVFAVKNISDGDEPEESTTTTVVTEDSTTPTEVTEDSATEAEVTEDSTTEAEVTEDSTTPTEVTEDSATEAEVTEDSTTPTEVTEDSATTTEATEESTTTTEATEESTTTTEATEESTTTTEVTEDSTTTTKVTEKNTGIFDTTAEEDNNEDNNDEPSDEDDGDERNPIDDFLSLLPKKEV